MIIDPPYNIGKDFGNNSDLQTTDNYLVWCDQWIAKRFRILKPKGRCLYTDLVKSRFIRVRIDLLTM